MYTIGTCLHTYVCMLKYKIISIKCKYLNGFLSTFFLETV